MDKKDFLKLLEQHESIKKEIKKLEDRLDRLNKQTSMISDVVQNGYKRHAVIFGVDLIRQDKIDRLKYILSKRCDALLEAQTKTEEFISTLKDSDIRQILEHRYIDNMNWVQIQIAMRIPFRKYSKNET